MSDAELELHDGSEATKEESKAIKAISKGTVHQLCSGQVVLSLAVAIKELVENSIDAGATVIEIKLHNQGLDSVDVSDNGCGVEESNLEAMTAKYHTSKLREFVDLQGVETFGFRGEALSSLCSLSNMTIVTRHSSTDVGLRIELDQNGKIKNKTPCARQIGTTVTLSNLFLTLPVRRREFERNIRREFSKMCQILQGYCLVSVGVRIICTNFNPKGNKSIILATNGSKNYLENVHAVFGAKQVSDLVKLRSPFEEELTMESFADLIENDSSFKISEEDIEQVKAKQFELEGWISSCEHGKGRGAKDRQYFFVNSRPCEPQSVAKVVNQIYHRYNLHQFPFVFLNVLTERSQVDINLTPDKRQLLVNNEKILLLAIKRALLLTFGKIPSTYKLNNTTIDQMFKVKPKETATANVTATATVTTIDSEDEEKIEPNKSAFLEVLSKWKATGNATGPVTKKAKKRKTVNEITARNAKMKKIQQYLATVDSMKQQKLNNSIGSYKSESDSDSKSDSESNKDCDVSTFNISEIKKESKEFDILLGANKPKESEELCERIDCKTESAPNIRIYEEKPHCSNYRAERDKVETETDSSSVSEREEPEEEELEEPNDITENITIQYDDSDEDSPRTSSEPSVTIETSIEKIKEALELERKLELESVTNKLDRLKFKSKIDPNENKSAEEELELEISKEMFAEMEIIGQFNLGFIIVRLGSDLLIVDQHASDEKYNFEELQKSTVMQNQKLAVPQRLEMTSDNEMVLIDYLDVFEKNGFKFEINENDPPTHRVKLLSKPMSKQWEFGKDDIDELIFMLKDAPKGTMCRPSRIRAMLASRACRKSVMIGTALDHSSMRTLINHMGEIDQPWNCPHGRPTMRHLINTEMLLAAKEDEKDEKDENEEEKDENEEEKDENEDEKDENEDEKDDSANEENSDES